MEHVEQLYKNAAEQQVPDIKFIKEQLEIVKYFIINNDLLVYGGIAIDLALKASGRAGIYTSETLPDYDFYSVSNIEDSNKLKRILNNDKIIVKNANHLTTRRVRYNRYTTLADISYYPPKYYNRINNISLVYDELKIVNPYFQKIDIYRSLAYIYEGPPGNEYFIYRMQKDLKRLKLLNEILNPELLHNNTAETINNDFMIGNLVGKKYMHKMKYKNVCYTGYAALYMYGLIDTLEFGGPLEYFIDKVQNIEDATYFVKSFNIFPQAAYTGTEMIYMSYGDVFCSKYFKKYEAHAASLHYIAAQFLFKYIMLGVRDFYDMFILAEDAIKDIPDEYFGSNYINKTWYYYELNRQQEERGLETKIYRPGVDTNPDSYETYWIDGRKTDKLDKKNI